MMAPIEVTHRADQYRRDQAALGGRIAAGTAQLVRERLNPADPDQGWAGLLAALIELIRGGRRVSEELAMEFYRYLREAEDAAGEAPEDLNIPFPTDSVVGGLIWNGPRLAKSLKRQGGHGSSGRELSARVGVMAGRSAMRQTLNAGRAATTQVVAQDPAAWGWARITDADPCKFCRMLADRGAVYKTARSAGRVFGDGGKELNRFHDGCACSVVAVFKGSPQQRRGSRRGADGLTDRQRAVMDRVRQQVDAEFGS